MPTGYTEKLHKGEQTAADFVREAALAFGLGRYKSLEELAAGEVDTFDAERLSDAKARLAEIEAWDYEQWHTEWLAHVSKVAAENVRSARLAEGVRRRYTAMRDTLEAWQAPESCAALKQFCLDQLETCWGETLPYVGKAVSNVEEFKGIEMAAFRLKVKNRESAAIREAKRNSKVKRTAEELLAELEAL